MGYAAIQKLEHMATHSVIDPRGQPTTSTLLNGPSIKVADDIITPIDQGISQPSSETLYLQWMGIDTDTSSRCRE